MTQTAPPIYAPRLPRPRLGLYARLVSFVIACGSLTVLLIAARLAPSASGVGTHEEMGMDACQFLRRTGVPCPACGMTTSFAHFVRGNLLASAYVQPMGCMLAILVTASFWVASYTAITGKPAYRLLNLVPATYYVLPLAGLAIAAWGWKIFIHLHGIDGWH